MMANRMIAISGGIGSGKSVVSEILSAMGYAVYDCDSEAKRLMDTSREIKKRISREISCDAVVDDVINRTLLGNIVFNDRKALETLNAIVHDAVRKDLQLWRESHRCRLCFVETAILYQSRIDGMVDEVWEVEAPADVRVERVMKRNGLSREQVEARIASQEFVPERYHDNTRRVTNDGCQAVLPQIERLLLNRANTAVCTG